ncbi:CSN8/PSMD8/EIF3K [Dillenia turbinata]|uniref:CSN8/PSMD8/EIF3K n=1 Tax=Dillenia turbinata TaxID=194707 RepID=A0AAN8VVV5_9MAGN
MDFSVLTNALASNSFDQVASQGIAFQEEWPYAIHLLGYMYVDDINSARFLWKSMPSVIKENNPEVLAAWKIGQRLWTRDYAGVYDAIRGFDWSQQVQDLVAAFLGKLEIKISAFLFSLLFGIVMPLCSRKIIESFMGESKLSLNVEQAIQQSICSFDWMFSCSSILLVSIEEIGFVL